MDTRNIEHLLVLQTMLVAAGVLTYSLNTELAGVGVLLGVVFPGLVLLGGVIYTVRVETDKRAPRSNSRTD
jgi:acyl dehydratase